MNLFDIIVPAMINFENNCFAIYQKCQWSDEINSYVGQDSCGWYFDGINDGISRNTVVFDSFDKANKFIVDRLKCINGDKRPLFVGLVSSLNLIHFRQD